MLLPILPLQEISVYSQVSKLASWGSIQVGSSYLFEGARGRTLVDLYPQELAIVTLVYVVGESSRRWWWVGL